MLSENIRTIRKAKGLSQEELAVKLNVVRQTISKWEQGLSVPDSELLLALSKALETPVSTLLGETVTDSEADDLKAISQKLEVINLQLSQRQQARRKRTQGYLIALAVITVLVTAAFYLMDSSYLEWHYDDPEMAVLGTIYHSFEWAFVRIAPFLLIGSVIGIVIIGRKDR